MLDVNGLLKVISSMFSMSEKDSDRIKTTLALPQVVVVVFFE